MPVRVQNQPGQRLGVNSVEVAAVELLKWDSGGPKWRKAVEACRAALEDRATPDKARKAFEVAAKEAGMLSYPL